MPSKDISGYFDYAAATPLDPKVLEVMQPYFVDYFYNPSALYQPAREVKQSIRAARTTVAKSIGAKPVEIIFTAGGTEANNLAIAGVMQCFDSSNLIISAVEHASVYKTAENYNHKLCRVKPDGRLNLQDLESKIDDHTVLISVILANNEIGVLQPIRRIVQIVELERKRRQRAGNKLPLYIHTDAAQATNYIDLQVARLGVDLMSVNGGKIYGPKQSGALYVRTGVQIKPTIFGGGQERALRSGTENIPGVIGFSEALKIATGAVKQNHDKIEKLRDYLIDCLQKTLSDFTINGSMKYRLPNNLNISFHGQDNERLIMQLDDLGYCVAAGSACSASDEEPSHVLKAIGLSEEDVRSSLRISLGKYTDKNSIDGLVQALKTSISKS